MANDPHAACHFFPLKTAHAAKVEAAATNAGLPMAMEAITSLSLVLMANQSTQNQTVQNNEASSPTG